MKRAVLMLAVCVCLAACHNTKSTAANSSAIQAQQCQEACLKCPCMQAIAQEAARAVLKEQEALRQAEKEAASATERQEAAMQQEKEFSQMADVRRHETGKVVVNYKNPIRFAWRHHLTGIKQPVNANCQYLAQIPQPQHHRSGLYGFHRRPHLQPRPVRTARQSRGRRFN